MAARAACDAAARAAFAGALAAFAAGAHAAAAAGVAGVEVARSAPTLWNSAFMSRYLWDASAASLEEQVQGPLYDPLEMGNNPANLLATLNSNTVYRQLFQQAFDRQADAITLDQIYLVIAAFETSLIDYKCTQLDSVVRSK